MFLLEDELEKLHLACRDWGFFQVCICVPFFTQFMLQEEIVCSKVFRFSSLTLILSKELYIHFGIGSMVFKYFALLHTALTILYYKKNNLHLKTISILYYSVSFFKIQRLRLYYDASLQMILKLQNLLLLKVMYCYMNYVRWFFHKD